MLEGTLRVSTLGRGGSDLTAVAIAGAIEADVCEIYTDVDGIYTTDPRIEPKAKKLDKISYDEMLELASLGKSITKQISRNGEKIKCKFSIKKQLYARSWRYINHKGREYYGKTSCNWNCFR